MVSQSNYVMNASPAAMPHPYPLKRPFVDDEPPHQKGSGNLDKGHEEKKRRKLPIRTSPSGSHQTQSDFQHTDYLSPHHAETNIRSEPFEDGSHNNENAPHHRVGVDADVDMSGTTNIDDNDGQPPAPNPDFPGGSGQLPSLNVRWDHPGGYRPSSTGNSFSAWNTLEPRPEARAQDQRSSAEGDGYMNASSAASHMQGGSSAEPDVDMGESDGVESNSTPKAPKQRRQPKIGFSMGFRADCEKCRLRVPGHYSHIFRAD